jgi:radical SAM protein with 4Fe4S-binding SPASM domain
MRNITFSFNTVVDIDKTKDLSKLANFVSSFKDIEWGLNASYTEDDPAKIKQVISVFDSCISQLVKRRFDVNRKLRFYNTVVGSGRGGCSAGVNSFGLGTNLEIWPCQSLANRNPIGYFDDNIKETLVTAPENEHFKKRRLMPECADCPVLGVCRGGCRATHENDQINDVVCQIRRNILGKLTSGYYKQTQNNAPCQENDNVQSKVSNGIKTKIHNYLDIADEKAFVETPEIGACRGA